METGLSHCHLDPEPALSIFKAAGYSDGGFQLGPCVLPAPFRTLQKDRDAKSVFETCDEKLGYDTSEQRPSKFKSGFQVVCANPALAYVFYEYLTTDALLIKILGLDGGKEL